MESTTNIPEPIILFEDDSLLVLSKPAGITVNRSETTIHEATIQDWIEKSGRWHVAGNALQDDSDFVSRAGIVHRLDKETSGILLVAKTPEAFLDLQRQFKERIVKKKYIALVHGRLTSQTGEINMPVGRLPWNRTRFGIVPGGKESVTMYRVLHTYEWLKKEPVTLVELEPHTGRTHQIRVHMKYLNHPIVADYLYAGRKVSQLDRKYLGRVFLHASAISFTHPQTEEKVSFSSPLPQELQSFLDTFTETL